MAKIIVLVLSFLLTINCFSQDKLKFKHLSVKDGLSNNKVFCALKDRNGFIWFGTASGLNRYDGYSFKVFVHNNDDSTSISDNWIRVMTEDKNGRIWIGTNNGLNCFDPVTETCKRFYTSSNDKSALSDNRISAICLSKDGMLWIGTENGLNRFEPNNFTNTRIVKELTFKNNEINRQITSITEDSGGSLWIGMWWGGLKKINPATLAVTSFFSDQSDPNGLSNDNVLSVFCANDNSLWITNYLGGLRRMNPETGQYLPDEGLTKMLDLGTIGQDKSGNIWIKTNPGSLIISHPSARSNVEISNRPGDDSSLSTGSISSIFCDRNGIVWITSDKGISFYNPEVMKFGKYYHRLDIDQRDYCKAFVQDINNQIWISVFDVGLVKYNPVNGETTTFSYNASDPNSINHKVVNGIFADEQGEIWLATNNGICIINSSTNRVSNRMFYNPQQSPSILNVIQAHSTGSQSHFFWPVEGEIFDVQNKKKWMLSDDGRISLNDLKIKCVIEDKKGDLWIGTEFFGLRHFQTATNQIKDYINVTSDSNSVSSNTIYDLCEDHAGNIWIATSNGLNRFNPENNKFTVYTKKRGLSVNECFSVKEDSHGNLWVLNSAGLDKFNVVTGTVTKYSEADGLSLNQTGLYQNEKGFLFGGHSENGFYMFHPDSITGTQSLQSVVFTDFLINYESVPIRNAKTESVLTKNINETTEIILNHHQKVFGFEFSSLNYSDNRKSRYAWKLDGFDDKWLISDGNNRRVNYTNLNPGTYFFRVKLANGDDYNSAIEKSIKIIILPPWWKTWWAFILWLIAFSTILFIIRKYFAEKRRLKHEMEIQRIEANKSAELARLKQQFFTNISHEFRTPLTLIKGPVDNLIQNIENTDQNKLRENLQMIKRNSDRLLQLTNQLLDIRKLETGHMKLEIVSENIVSFIKNIAEGFVSLAEKKHISFLIQSEKIEENEAVHWFDPDKIHKIIVNLLSNAFKFTPENGRISLLLKHGVDANGSEVIVEVEDSGLGIPEDEQQKIFGRFYQVENARNRVPDGTGIGLALTRELALLHGGDISVESRPGIGSKFSVRLTVDKEKLTNYIVDNQVLNRPEFVYTPEEQSLNDLIQDKPISSVSEETLLPLVLLVEDNDDIRLFVRNKLLENYRILEADNGKQGLEIALAELPHLIISDVMMPLMDGFELTHLIKTDERTSHIPIILLTSLSSSENIIEGLSNEADEYLTKPFNEQILLLKVRNLLLSRQKLKSSYLEHFENNYSVKRIDLTPSQPLFPDTEKIFLDKLIAIVERNFAEPGFDVPQFALEVGMEASVLHRKLKALINQSPGDFIRTLRMKRAAQLLADKSISIGEAANQVGFGNNTNYFSTAFRKHFGKTPREFQNSQL